MRSAIYRPRWQYHAPWKVTRPWLPRVGRGEDEWCNPSVYVLTPLGMVVVFWKPGPLRTEADGPCAECLAFEQVWEVVLDEPWLAARREWLNSIVPSEQEDYPPPLRRPTGDTA